MSQVVEHGLGHLPFTEKQITTPTGSVASFAPNFCLAYPYQQPSMILRCNVYGS
jgi:hypothetical protein